MTAHLDHGLDPGSAARSDRVEELARRLGTPLVRGRVSPPAGPISREAWARRERYRFLDRCADDAGARFIATAHHADDQAETVLLRLLFGSGLEGLAAIRPRDRRRVRPLLGLRCRDLRRYLESRGLATAVVDDPTNRDLAVPRNRVRHRILPDLESRDPDLVPRLCRVAAAAARLGERLRAVLDDRLEPRTSADPGTAVGVRRKALERLPAALFPHALAYLHRLAGAAYPPAAAARRELLRQLSSGARVGCDCGGGWRWESTGRPPGATLLLTRSRPPEEAGTLDFTYTLEAPGETEIPELGLRLRLEPGRAAPWMRTPQDRRTALAGPLGRRFEVRTRRPGDRLRPLGSKGTRRLKDLLIDRRIPRNLRDRLPLLVIDGTVAWVPGVTIDERFRLGSDTAEVWVAELIEQTAGRE